MLRRIVLRSSILVVIISAFCSAQEIKPSNDTGLRPLTPYATGDGNVNLTNGNLNLQIPLIPLPGRGGMSYTFSLVYDSKMWSPHPQYASPTDVVYTWTDDSLLGDGGWSFNTPRLQNGPWLTDGTGNHIGNGDYIVTLLDGSKHALGRTGYFILTDYSRDAEDGSGLNITPDNPNDIVVREKSGITYHFMPTQTKVEDTNGNFILFTQTGVTDSLGRTISITYLTNPQRTTISYQDSGGTSRTFTLNYGTVQILTKSATPFTYPQPRISGSCGNGKTVCIYVSQPTNIAKTVLSSLTLPDNNNYTFSYAPSDPNAENYGELTKVVYPTGGYVVYEYSTYQHQETYWAYYMSSCIDTDPCAWLNIQSDFREVSKKRVCSANVGVNGTCPSEDITVFVPAIGSSTTSNYGDDEYEGVPASDTSVPPTHYLRRTVQGYSYCDQSDLNFYRYCTPKDAGKNIYDSTGVLLKSTSIAYSQYGYYDFLPISITTSYNGGPSSIEQLSYDTQTVHVLQPLGVDFSLQTLQDITLPIDNVVEHKIFDYGQTATPMRREVTSYLKAVPYSYLHILDRKLEQQIYDGSNSLVADTQYEYDNPLDGTVASGAVSHDSHLAGGNVSAIKRWRNTDGAWLVTKNRKLDDAGNVLLVEDPMGHQTQLFYDDSWGNSSCAPQSGSAKAYLTKVITPTGTTTQGTYNSCTGKVASITDANSQATTFTYDLFGRVLTALSPLNGSISFTYPDPNTVNRSQSIAAGTSLNHTITFDGRGRIVQSALTSDPDPGGYTYTDTAYDAVGRVQSVSNPYRQVDTKYYTTTVYDGLDRPKTVTQPDGSSVQTVYSQNSTTVTDEAGKQRETFTDALGRLTQVLEPDSTGALNWQTNYTYDTLGNLLCVEQRGDAGAATGCSTADYFGGPWRVRRFYYNSLSQLTLAKNPESNAISYTYDNDGNVLTKTDANGSVTTFAYVNDRIFSKVYNPGQGVASTPPVYFFYDNVANGNFGRGRQIGMTDGSGSTSWIYDAKGRVSQLQRTINGYAKTISYGYNLDDSVASITYPSGRVINYLAGGAGRPLSAIEGVSGPTYVSGTCGGGACYTASGALSGAKFGSNITLSNSYNSRLQPSTLSASVGANTIMSRTYDFHEHVGDNGNVFGITDGLDQFNIANRPIGSATFQYDNLNRLIQAKSTGTDCTSMGGAKNWGNTYTIDAWGNLTNKGAVTGLTNCYAESLNESVGYDNRFTGTGRYDLAGNMVSYGAYTFDAENRLLKLAGDSNARYIYDGNGNRVAKPTMLYWMGADGSILAESNASGYITSEYIFFNGKRVARIDLP